MHIDTEFDYSTFEENIKRFSDLGIEVHITELDIKCEPNCTDAKLQE